jgi:hypothetical protein
VIAFLFWPVASLLSGCSDPGYCDDFTGPQVVARMIVAFSPMWLLVLAALAFRFRSALVVFAIASLAMAVVTFALYTDLRLALRPLGLSSATGFILYSIPCAVSGIAAYFDLRRG